MPNFNRSFDTSKLATWCDENPGNAIEPLFERWALPGNDVSNERPLRLAVRDGYLNFYAKGQSVAKLSIVHGVPRLEVHNAYVTGRERGVPRKSNSASGTYRRYDAATLADPGTADLIQGWIETALTHAGTEKRFVDDLVATNPAIIDLEMGLPTASLPNSGRAAPRMDLVVAQVTDEAQPSIAFWEAKCANNGELRSTKKYEDLGPDGFAGPKVLGQITKYIGWMQNSDDRTEVVSEAYRDAAATLLELHGKFRKGAHATESCVQIWKKLSEGVQPKIVIRPGIVVGNYKPNGDKMATAEALTRHAATFKTNGHRKKLEFHGVCVHEVGPDHDDHVLPPLSMADRAT